MTEKIKVLNLYAGIGGNRKLWKNVDVTAVEIIPKIGDIYKGFYPNDNVIIGDAHQYLLNHYKEFDFIWSSPPCPTHSRARFWGHSGKNPIYPDITLYQEIIFLKHHFNGKFCVENVIGYYEPLIKPVEVNRHYFWCNFFVNQFTMEHIGVCQGKDEFERLKRKLNIIVDDVKLLRNCVEPELGLHVFKCAFKIKQTRLA